MNCLSLTVLWPKVLWDTFKKMPPFPKLWKASILYTMVSNFYAHKPGLYWKKKSPDGLNQVPKLTRREKEILAEAAKGLTTNQMAEKLFISPHTVESHRKNLIEKFQTSNLSSAIKLAIEYGLIIE